MKCGNGRLNKNMSTEMYGIPSPLEQTVTFRPHHTRLFTCVCVLVRMFFGGRMHLCVSLHAFTYMHAHTTVRACMCVRADAWRVSKVKTMPVLLS